MSGTDHAAWLARWREGKTGFHRSDVHGMLARHWPPPGVAGDATVFVPLAGKSLDMHWLAGQGHRVVGVELSPLAVRGFFDDAGLDAGTGRHAGMAFHEYGRVRLFEGDLFDLVSDHLGDVSACYDRASLVALDAGTRTRYAARLAALLPPGSGMLLVTVDYPPHEMAGPPFAVADDEVRRLFGGAFDVSALDTVDVLADEPRFRERGVTRMTESAWHLVRRDQK